MKRKSFAFNSDRCSLMLPSLISLCRQLYLMRPKHDNSHCYSSHLMLPWPSVNTSVFRTVMDRHSG